MRVSSAFISRIRCRASQKQISPRLPSAPLPLHILNVMKGSGKTPTAESWLIPQLLHRETRDPSQWRPAAFTESRNWGRSERYLDIATPHPKPIRRRQVADNPRGPPVRAARAEAKDGGGLSGLERTAVDQSVPHDQTIRAPGVYSGKRRSERQPRH